MTPPTAVLPHPVLRLLYGALALALAAGWLVAAALPADAADWSVQSPAAGAVITGDHIDVAASVTNFPEEGIETVEARLRRGDSEIVRVGLNQRGAVEGTPIPGQQRSTWQGSISTRGLANGTYAVEVSVNSSNPLPSGGGWRGHQIVVDQAPTARLELARVADADARTVELRWASSSAPDHVRYVLQRAHGAAAFVDVHTATAAGASGHIDTVPEYGEYRYRIKVVRKAADGSDREAISEQRTVEVTPSASERPETGGEPEGREPGEGEAGPSGDGSGTAAPRLSGRSRPPSSTSGRSQRPNVAPPNPNSTFEERLDYGELPDWVGEGGDGAQADDPQVAGAAGDDGGTLTVFGGEDGGTEQILKPVAGGLVLTLFGLHIVRFLRESPEGPEGP